MICFWIPGNPQSLKRHRTFRRGKFIGQYDPSASDKMDFLAKCMQHRPEKPFAGPVSLDIVAMFQRPANHFNSKGEIKPKHKSICYTVRKHDWDNIGKFVSDALNGIFYLDDCQICFASVERCYSNTNEPGVRISINEIEQLT